MTRSGPGFIAVGIQVLMALGITVVIISTVVHLTGISFSVATNVYSDATRQLVENNTDMDVKDSPILKQIMEEIGVKNISRAVEDGPAKFYITYNGASVDHGAFVPMQQAATAPQLHLIDPGDNMFTWILVDIDAPDPSNPTHAPFLHYILANVVPKSMSNAVAVSYYPVTPPIGNHRYISLLFLQPKVASTDQLEQYQAQYDGNRSNFDVVGYATRENLVFSAITFFFSHPNI